MVEYYNNFVTKILLFFNDKIALFLAFTFLFIAFWLVVKRRQPRAGAICVIVSAGIAFGYTLFIYIRRIYG